MTKNILLKPRFKGWGLHSLYSELIDYPPSGFKIHFPNEVANFALHSIDNRSTNPIFKEFFFHTKSIPYILAQKFSKYDFRQYDLIYASQHVLFDSSKPWIADLEFANSLSAYGSLALVKKIIQKALEHRKCKFIMPWSEWSKKTLLVSLDCNKFKEKIKVIHYTVRPKNFLKKKHEEVNILLVGSSNPMNIQNIQYKNIKEVILAFNEICKKYSDVTLTIRSFLSPELKQLANKNKRIEIIDYFITKEELHDLYLNADIFALPSHETCGISLLDAMSFGLPVISMNIYDIPEIITHMKNGLLIEPSRQIKYYTNTGIPYDYSKQFMEGMKNDSEYITNQLIKNFSKLVEESSLRIRLGNGAKQIIDSGLLSIEKRNEDLRQIFESSIR